MTNLKDFYLQVYKYIFQVRCFISHTLIPNFSWCK